MRAIWSGSISWGLVNIPIKLYSAVESGGPDFRMLCKEHHAPIHYKRVCEEGGEEVPWNNIVSGLEIGKDDYFILTRDELDKLKPGGQENFEIIEFVDSDALKDIYYNKSYFVAPGEKSEKPYFLFKGLLEEMGLIAIGKFVMKNKEHLCALQPYEQGMLLYILHYHQYVRDIGEVVPAKQPEIGAKEKELGKQLIEKYREQELRMEEFRDTFMDRLKDLVRRKLAGEEIEIGELPQAPEEVTLLDALEASLGAAKPAAAAAAAQAHAAAEAEPAAEAEELVQEYAPMLCETGVNTVLDEDGYIFEPKLDGTRCIAAVTREEVKLINRRARNITKRFPEIVRELQKIPQSCILDGEIVCFNEDQVPDFSLLQKRAQIESELKIEALSKTIPATYVVFDLLKRDDKVLIDEPLLTRKKALADTVADTAHVKKIAYETDGAKLWDELRKKSMEGVVAKREKSMYYPGKRSWNWLKVKHTRTIDVVLIGYTTQKRAISAFGMALYEEGDLVYIGSVGTGFTDAFIENLKNELTALELQTESPSVSNPNKAPKEMNWLNPQLVATIKYSEITEGGELRAPSFQELRPDKPPEECGSDQLWKGRIEECIEVFNHEVEQPATSSEIEQLYEDYIEEQPTLLKGGSAIPYDWVKAKLEAYRMD